MNIFASDADPVTCARALDDARVRKMAVETAQLLSAAVRETLGDRYADANALYKRPPSGQELVRWAVSDLSCYRWLLEHGNALVTEGRLRGLTVGAAGLMMGLFPDPELIRWRLPDYTKTGRLAPGFVNRARNVSKGLDYSTWPSVHEAYRTYLRARWAGEKPTWGFRGPPAFALVKRRAEMAVPASRIDPVGRWDG
jgi:hypothetical protein